MDGVMVALGSRGMTVEAARQCVKDRKEWRTLVYMQIIEYDELFCLVPVFSRSTFPRSGGLSPARGVGWHYMRPLG